MNTVYSKFLQSKYPGYEFEVDVIGLNHMVLSEVKVRHERHYISIDRILLDFDLLNFLKERRLKKVTIIQLEVTELDRHEPFQSNIKRETSLGSSKAKVENFNVPVLIDEILLEETRIKHPKLGTLNIPEIHGEVIEEQVVFNLDFPFLNHVVELQLSCRYLEPDFPYELSLVSGKTKAEESMKLLEVTGDLHQMKIESNLFKDPISGVWKQGQGVDFKLSLDQFQTNKLLLDGFDVAIVKDGESDWKLKAEGQSADFGKFKLSSFKLLFPLQNSKEKGYLLGSIKENTLGPFEFDFEISHDNQKIMLQGDYSLPKLSLLELPFELIIDYAGENFLPDLKVVSEFSNKELSVFTEEFQLMEGHLSASVNTALHFGYDSEAGWQESFYLSCHNGFFANSDFSMTVSGMELNLSSDQIFSMNTGPSQMFSWKNFKSQGMEFVDGKVFWQWERQQKLFIESLKMGWCGGSLSLLPLRLEEERSDFEFTFFCERVELAQVLKSFQVGEVEGEGELGGKISFAFDNGKWRFEDTYLYSDPAQEGRLLIKEAQLLDQAMGQSQLQLARESLKDYKYKWAKVNFVSENDNLLLRLVMDGKPNGLLPFRFDPKTAQFIYDKSSPGVNLQGLKLNTNFRSEQFMPLLERSLNFLKKIELE